MTVIPRNSGDIPVIEDGLYDLTCVACGIEHRTKEDGKTPDPDQWGRSEFVRFRFEVDGAIDEEGPTYVSPRTSLSLYDGSGRSPNQATLFKIATVLGVNVDAGFDTDLAIGRRCQGFIQTRPEPDSWPQVIQWLPPKVKNAPAQPATKPAAKAPTTARGIAVVPEIPAAGAPGRLIALLKDYRSRMPENEYLELREQLWILFPETDAFTPQGNRAFFPQRLTGENLLAAIDYLVTHPPADVDEEGF